MKKSFLFTLMALLCLNYCAVAQNNQNAIQFITPYYVNGTWVFDDERVGLVQEPFVSGIPAMIDELTSHIPDAQEGFTLFFSEKPIPEYQVVLTWRRKEYAGNWYFAEKYEMEGWLCPALFKYFEKAPAKLYITAIAKK